MADYHRFRAGSTLDEESQEEHGHHNNSRMLSTQKAERASSLPPGKAKLTSKPKNASKGKKTGAHNVIRLGPLLSASPYNKSIAQVYKNLEALRQNTESTPKTRSAIHTYSSNHKDGGHDNQEDPFLPYLAPMEIPKAPAKVKLDLKTNCAHIIHSTSVSNPSEETSTGLVVASGTVGEEPR